MDEGEWIYDPRWELYVRKQKSHWTDGNVVIIGWEHYALAGKNCVWTEVCIDDGREAIETPIVVNLCHN